METKALQPAMDALWPVMIDTAGALELRAAALAEQARRQPLPMLLAALAFGYLAGRTLRWPLAQD